MQNLDHLGIVAGIIDEIGLVEQVNQLVGQQPGEIVSPGLTVEGAECGLKQRKFVKVLKNTGFYLSSGNRAPKP